MKVIRELSLLVLTSACEPFIVFSLPRPAEEWEW